jgi:hypothetical protein
MEIAAANVAFSNRTENIEYSLKPSLKYRYDATFLLINGKSSFVARLDKAFASHELHRERFFSDPGKQVY